GKHLVGVTVFVSQESDAVNLSWLLRAGDEPFTKYPNQRGQQEAAAVHTGMVGRPGRAVKVKCVAFVTGRDWRGLKWRRTSVASLLMWKSRRSFQYAYSTDLIRPPQQR